LSNEQIFKSEDFLKILAEANMKQDFCLFDAYYSVLLPFYVFFCSIQLLVMVHTRKSSS